MKKQTGFGKGLAMGLVLSALVGTLGVSALAAVSNRTIQVEDGFSISINGASFTPRDANGSKVSVFRYNGTVYAPVRAVCEAAGMDVDYDSATRTVELTTADQLTTADYITEAEAKSIALKDAGVKESAAVFLTVRLDWDDGRPEYEVEFYSGQTEYDYEIHAVTGAILSSDRDLENFEIPTVSVSSDDMISAEKAKSIALERHLPVLQCSSANWTGTMAGQSMRWKCEMAGWSTTATLTLIPAPSSSGRAITDD